MKQQEVFRKTGAIIKELNEQYEYLQSTADDLNDLELELFVANTHFLKDHAEILRKLNLQKLQVQHTLSPHVDEPKPEEKMLVIEEPKIPATPEPKATVTEEVKKAATGEPKYFEPLVQQVKTIIERPPLKPVEPIQLETPSEEYVQPTPLIDLHTGNDNDTYAVERKEPEEVEPDLVINEANDWDEEIIPEEEAITISTEDKPDEFTQASVTDILDDRPIVVDEPKADETQAPHIVPTNPEPVIDNTPKIEEELSVKETKPLSFNERMSAQLKGNNGTGTEPAQAPIQDIKAAISLNDKLLFVKDLFNGYSLAYSEAIEIVNRFTSFEEADRFLKTNYVVKNNWDGKKATADKFYALLKRRYA